MKETESYAEAFWKRIKDVEGHEKIIESIEKGEKAIELKRENDRMVRLFVMEGERKV